MEPDASRVADKSPPAVVVGNARFLLAQRFAFIRDHVRPGQRVLEVGAGQGHLRPHLENVELIQTDVHDGAWLDVKASGERLPFADGAFDAVVCVAAIHHMNFPLQAMAEMSRVTRPGGKLLILEAHNSRLLRLLLRVRDHEYVDEAVDPYADRPCQRDDDPWGGNNALGDLVFGQLDKFRRRFPEFERLHHRYAECLVFVNSGGITHKAPSLPLPGFALAMLAGVDRVLCALAPDQFALVQEIVLQKR